LEIKESERNNTFKLIFLDQLNHFSSLENFGQLDLIFFVDTGQKLFAQPHWKITV